MKKTNVNIKLMKKTNVNKKNNDSDFGVKLAYSDEMIYTNSLQEANYSL